MKVLLMTFNSSYIHPNLALRWLYVARDKRHDVIIKEYTIKDNLDKVIKEVEDLNVDVIGLSTYIWNADITKEFIKRINIDNKYRIILGGPEVSYESEEWFNLNIEGVIKGEGEIAFWKAVNNDEDVDGYFTKDHIPTISQARVDISYLESLESPYFLSIDDDSRANRYLYFETSRGCPYQCSYCLSSLDNKLRNFSLEYVFDNLAKLKKYKVKQLKFLDRTFNSDPKRALALARFINDLDVDISFQLEVALEFFSLELLDFFKDAKRDRFRFEVGVQSFNPKTLKAIRRPCNEDKLIANIKYMSDLGYVLHTDLIAGLPFEDYNSFKNSFNKLYALHSSEIQMGTLKMLKGTKMKNDSDLNDGIIYDTLPPYEIIQTEELSKEDVVKIKACAYILERCYNRGRMKRCFDILFDKGYDLFEIMVSLGLRIKSLKNVQLKDYYLELVKVLKDYNVLDAKAMVLNDYYYQFNERPAPLFQRPDNEFKKAFYQKLISEGYDEFSLYQYSILDYAYHPKLGVIYQLVFYNKNHHLDRIEYFDQSLKLISYD